MNSDSSVSPLSFLLGNTDIKIMYFTDICMYLISYKVLKLNKLYLLNALVCTENHCYI